MAIPSAVSPQFFRYTGLLDRFDIPDPIEVLLQPFVEDPLKNMALVSGARSGPSVSHGDSSAPATRVRGFLARGPVVPQAPAVIAPSSLASGAVVYVKKGFRLSDLGGGKPPGDNDAGGVKRFESGETLANFIKGHFSETFFLGFNPDDNVFEAHARTTSVPTYCTIKMEIDSNGRPSFYVRGHHLNRTEPWVSLCPDLWFRPSTNGPNQARRILESMVIITNSILVSGLEPLSRHHLPRPYTQRIGLIYELYQMYQRCGGLHYFHEMMRLKDQRGNYIPFYFSTRGDLREDISDFVERLYATMGLTEFVIMIDVDSSVQAYPDVATFLQDGVKFAFWIKKISHGFFSVKTRTQFGRGEWKELPPKDSSEGTHVFGDLVDQAEAAWDVPSHILNNDRFRQMTDSLLLLTARAVDARDMTALIESAAAVRQEGYEGFLEQLFNYFCYSQYVANFLMVVPCVDHEQPVRRLLSALSLFTHYYFGDYLKSKIQDKKLGTYGWYYLNCVLRFYAAERVRRYFKYHLMTLPESVRPRALAEYLNKMTDHFFSLLGTTRPNEKFVWEMKQAPFDRIFGLAQYFRQESNFAPGSNPRYIFTYLAQDIANSVNFPADANDN